MLRYFLKVSFLIGSCCLLLLACGEKGESPEPQQPVRQKISVPTPPPAKPTVAAPEKVAAEKAVKAPEAKAEAPAAPAQTATAQQPEANQPKESLKEKAAPEKPEPAVQAAASDAAAAALPQIKLEQAPAVGDTRLGELTTDETDAAEDDTARIDPFAPLFKEESSAPVPDTRKKDKQERRIPLTPLEKIDISQLRLVGIVHAPSGARALIEEATGKGYVVTRGTYIGLNSGQIIEILKDRLVIEEETEDSLGKVTISRRELELQKPPGEM